MIKVPATRTGNDASRLSSRAATNTTESSWSKRAWTEAHQQCLRVKKGAAHRFNSSIDGAVVRRTVPAGCCHMRREDLKQRMLSESPMGKLIDTRTGYNAVTWVLLACWLPTSSESDKDLMDLWVDSSYDGEFDQGEKVGLICCSASRWSRSLVLCKLSMRLVMHFYLSAPYLLL